MISYQSLLLLVAVGLAGTLRLPAAHAQPNGDFEDLYNSAQAKAKQGKYTESLADFERAYQIHKEPTVALAMGLLNLQLHRAQAALRLCEQYVHDVPDPPPAKRSQAASCIAQATVLAKAQQARKAPPVSPALSETTDTPAATPTSSVASASPAAGVPLSLSVPQLQKRGDSPGEPITLATSQPPSWQPAPIASAAPPSPIYKKWWFWTVLGGVTAGAALGLGLGLGLASQPQPAPPVVDERLQRIPVENRIPITF